MAAVTSWQQLSRLVYACISFSLAYNPPILPGMTLFGSDRNSMNAALSLSPNPLSTLTPQFAKVPFPDRGSLSVTTTHQLTFNMRKQKYHKFQGIFTKKSKRSRSDCSIKSWRILIETGRQCHGAAYVAHIFIVFPPLCNFSTTIPAARVLIGASTTFQ